MAGRSVVSVTTKERQIDMTRFRTGHSSHVRSAPQFDVGRSTLDVGRFPDPAIGLRIARNITARDRKARRALALRRLRRMRFHRLTSWLRRSAPATCTHRARLSEHELVESNLPLR